MTFEIWIAFVLAASANIIAPGPAIVLAIKNGMSLGMKKTFYSSLGNIIAIGCVGLAVTLGLGAVITTEPKILSALRVLGGSYLIWLAYQTWHKGMISLDHLNQNTTDHSRDSADPIAQKDTETASFLFRQSLMVGLTNPKMIIFLLALFPLFLDKSQAATPQLLIMTLTFMALSFLSLSAFALTAVKLARIIRQEAIVRMINKSIALIFFGFGAALLTVGFWK